MIDLDVLPPKATYQAEDSAKKRRMVVLGIATFAMVLAISQSGIFDNWAKSTERNAMRPTMESLANQGKDAAALWLVRNYPDSEMYRLDELIAKGNPGALFIGGLLKMRSDKTVGEQMIERAAATGLEEAVRYRVKSQLGI